MKTPVLLFLLLWFAAGCGKVGDPRPPVIRIPARITDLKAEQDQFNVVLSWTNPSRYVDGAGAVDLASVRILRDGRNVEVAAAGGPGKPQTAVLAVRDAVGSTLNFSLQVETTRGKISDISNGVPIPIVDIPGMVGDLKAEMDQHQMELTWKLPDTNPQYANVFIVRREDMAFVPQTVTASHFEDAQIEAGKSYRYVVTAVRTMPTRAPGPPTISAPVVARDQKPPQTPSGLQMPLVTDGGAILRWNPNGETDLTGYRIYRSDNPASGFAQVDALIHPLNSFRDDNYRPGVYYAISAVDTDGNESSRSAPVQAP